MSPVTHVVDAEDWDYIQPNPTFSGLNFRLADTERDLYEAVIVRNPDTDVARYQPVFWIYPELMEWPMSDLFSKHPTKPNLWRYEGRRDDMIVMDFGHNFHPVYYETDILAKDPLVRSALIFGNGRPKLGVILELNNGPPDSVEMEKALQEIWPTIEECNRRATKVGQIERDRIIFASCEKPFVRTGKGTVQRADTVKLYKEEIDRLYRGGKVDSAPN